MGGFRWVDLVVGGLDYGWVLMDGSAVGGWVGGGSGWVYGMRWVGGTVVGCVFRFCFCFYFSVLVVVI